MSSAITSWAPCRLGCWRRRPASSTGPCSPPALWGPARSSPAPGMALYPLVLYSTSWYYTLPPGTLYSTSWYYTLPPGTLYSTSWYSILYLQVLYSTSRYYTPPPGTILPPPGTILYHQEIYITSRYCTLPSGTPETILYLAGTVLQVLYSRYYTLPPGNIFYLQVLYSRNIYFTSR